MVCLCREVSLVRQEGRENGRRSARGDPNEVAQTPTVHRVETRRKMEKLS